MRIFIYMQLREMLKSMRIVMRVGIACVVMFLTNEEYIITWLRKNYF